MQIDSANCGWFNTDSHAKSITVKVNWEIKICSKNKGPCNNNIDGMKLIYPYKFCNIYMCD